MIPMQFLQVAPQVHAERIRAAQTRRPEWPASPVRHVAKWQPPFQAWRLIRVPAALILRITSAIVGGPTRATAYTAADEWQTSR